jgi:polyisoprenoid-binding protein YceI
VRTATKLSELTGDYVLDTAHTKLGFVARAAMLTDVRGQFDEFEGAGHVDGGDPTNSSAQLTIQAKSIQTRNGMRDGHLRRHFLDVNNHPTITFTSTRVEQSDETNFKTTGELTIRGVTMPVTVDFELTGAETDPGGNLQVGLEGKATINRRDWSVNWKAAGLFVGEKVSLEFDVVAVRQVTDGRDEGSRSPARPSRATLRPGTSRPTLEVERRVLGQSR